MNKHALGEKVVVIASSPLEILASNLAKGPRVVKITQQILDNSPVGDLKLVRITRLTLKLKVVGDRIVAQIMRD